jgi:esterase/lipase
MIRPPSPRLRWTSYDLKEALKTLRLQTHEFFRFWWCRQQSHPLCSVHAEKELRRIPDAELWNHFCAAMPRSDDPNLTLLEKKNPAAQYVPVKLLVQLWRLMPQAVKGMKTLTVPVLVLQGTGDHLVRVPAVARIFGRCPSPDKTFHSIEGGRHSAMVGTTKH